MKSITSILTVAFLASVSLDADHHAVKLNDHLKPLEMILGTWVSEGTTPDGQKFTTTMNNRIVANGSAIAGYGVVAIDGKTIDSWHSTMHLAPDQNKIIDIGISPSGKNVATIHVSGNEANWQETIHKFDGTAEIVVSNAVFESDTFKFDQISKFVNGAASDELVKNGQFERVK